MALKWEADSPEVAR